MLKLNPTRRIASLLSSHVPKNGGPPLFHQDESTTCQSLCHTHTATATINCKKSALGMNSAITSTSLFYSPIFPERGICGRREMICCMSVSTRNDEESHIRRLPILYRTMGILYFAVASFLIFFNLTSPPSNQLTSSLVSNVSEMTLANKYSAINISGAIGFFLASLLSLFLHKYQDSKTDEFFLATVTTSAATTTTSEYGNNCTMVQPHTLLVDDFTPGNEHSITSRLDFGLGMFSLIGLFSIPGELVLFMPSFPRAMGLFSLMTLSRLIGTWYCWNKWFRENNHLMRWSWRRSSRMDDVNVNDETTRGKKYLGLYAMMQVFAFSRILHNVMSILHASKHSSLNNLWFMKSIYISAASRLCLVWSIASALQEDLVTGNMLVKKSRLHLQFLLGIWAVSVGILSGFIDAKLLLFILQKSVYFMVFAWPIMLKGRNSK